MSLFNTSTETLIITPLPAHITKSHVLSVLHNGDTMIRMNPLIRAHHRLPDSSSIAFFKSEAAEDQPSDPETIIPVYHLTETASGDEAQGGSWRGGWAKRFVPESITYEMSMLFRDDGLLSITHAPMGVHSRTAWIVRDGEDGGLVLEERGTVTSNRMLMGFIKTTLYESHAQLVKYFMAFLEKKVAGEDAGEVEKVD